MAKKDKKSILVFGTMERPTRRKIAETLGIADVPLEAIKTNMEIVLGEVVEMFNEVRQKLGNCRVEHMDLTLGIAVDGSVGIFGSGVSAEAKGGMTLRIKFE